MTRTRLLIPVLLAAAVLAAAAPAQAAAYRYWSFWRWTGAGWAYQQQGPATYLPPDGSVDGWRFALSPDGGRDAARPDGGGEFAVLCANTPARDGFKRVGVLLDFGTRADAPSTAIPPIARTACAQVRSGASSAEVLAAAAPPLRYDSNGMLCAIAGYPAAGCGEVLSGAAPARPRGTPMLPLPAALALIGALALGAGYRARRRSA
ncbi:SCO2322 family protein [Kitasatospora azatica]|uniref:SCO2322 family protein n=1 Tax=Kitasatospora azatica TaxID=58347 RepID=UPI0005622882|nr:SCO2322 family protein [Kitasatospora azatica]